MSLVREQWAQTLIPAHKAKSKPAYAGTLSYSIARINPSLEPKPGSGAAAQLLHSHFQNHAVAAVAKASSGNTFLHGARLIAVFLHISEPGLRKQHRSVSLGGTSSVTRDVRVLWRWQRWPSANFRDGQIRLRKKSISEEVRATSLISQKVRS